MASIDRSSTFCLTFGYRIALLCTLIYLCVYCVHSTFSSIEITEVDKYNKEEYQDEKTFGQFYFTSLFFAFDFFLPFLIEYYQFCTKRIPFIMWLKCTLSSILTCDRKHSHMNRINIILNSFSLCSLHFFFLLECTKEFEWVLFYLLLYTNNDDVDDNDNDNDDSMHKIYKR